MWRASRSRSDRRECSMSTNTCFEERICNLPKKSCTFESLRWRVVTWQICFESIRSVAKRIKNKLWWASTNKQNPKRCSVRPDHENSKAIPLTQYRPSKLRQQRIVANFLAAFEYFDIVAAQQLSSSNVYWAVVQRLNHAMAILKKAASLRNKSAGGIRKQENAELLARRGVMDSILISKWQVKFFL